MNSGNMLSLDSIKGIFGKMKSHIREYTMVFALLGIWAVFAILTEGIFISPRNLSNLFRQMTIIGFLATGMVLVIVTGNIDLSIGSVAGFVSVIAALLQSALFPSILPEIFPGASVVAIGVISTIFTIILSIAVGVIVGIWQGAIIAYLRVPAFIVTLGGMLIFRGGILGVTQGRTITPIDDSLRLIAQGYIPNSLGSLFAIVAAALIFAGYFLRRKNQRTYGFDLEPVRNTIIKAAFFSAIAIAFVAIMNSYRGIPIPALILVVSAIAVSYISTNTRFGRYTYAIGGNAQAARFSGINIKRTTFRVFVLMGFMCGVAGTILTAYVAAGTPTAGTLFELDAIAACVIGGVSLAGGSGKIFGALIGALTIASLINGMSVMNVDILWQYIARGLVLILAVYIDVRSRQLER